MSIKTAPVGELSEQIRGVTFAKSDAVAEPADGYLPVLRAGNITDNGVDFEDLLFVPADRINDRQMLRANDVLIAASSGSLSVVGKAARMHEDFGGGFGAFCKVLRPNQSIDPGYFSHYFQTGVYRRKISSLAAGANINNLRGADLDGLRIPLPPLPEQRRIAEILDRADALRAKRRQAIAKLDSLTQSIFIDMFGIPTPGRSTWPLGKVGDMLTSANYGTGKKAGSTGSFPVLRMGNITAWGEIDMTDLKYMDLADPEVPKYTVRRGDVLFNRTNSAELVGKTAIYRATDAVAFAGYLIRLRVNESNDPEYLAAFMNTSFTKTKLKAMCKSIVGMANINATEVQGITIPLPPLEMQQKFADRIAGIELQKLQHASSKRELDALFASLQHRAFSGQL